MNQQFACGGLATTLALLFGPPAAAAQSMPGTVPYVGCAADGQLGPVAPPRKTGAIPPVTAAAASRLAYYATGDLAVLAPRGWHCFGLYSSSGSTLVVTPEAHGFNELTGAENFALTGPAVVLAYSYGGTSGRFTVARIAARLFPTARPFVRQVAGENAAGPGVYPTGLSRSDRQRRLGPTEVEYQTPADRDGIGTTDWLAKGAAPVTGAAILLAADSPDLVKLDIRLPTSLRDLSRTIVTSFEHDEAPAALNAQR